MNAHVPSSLAATVPDATDPASIAFRAAMRKLAGGVSVLTVGQGRAPD